MQLYLNSISSIGHIHIHYGKRARGRNDPLLLCNCRGEEEAPSTSIISVTYSSLSPKSTFVYREESDSGPCCTWL